MLFPGPKIALMKRVLYRRGEGVIYDLRLCVYVYVCFRVIGNWLLIPGPIGVFERRDNPSEHVFVCATSCVCVYMTAQRRRLEKQHQ